MYYDYVEQIYKIIEIQKSLAAEYGKHLSKAEVLDQFCTCHLDIGRRTTKTNAAATIAMVPGNALIPPSTKYIREIRQMYPHMTYYPKYYVKDTSQVLGKTFKSGNILVVDEPSCGEVITREQIIEFATLLDYKHVVILGH